MCSLWSKCSGLHKSSQNAFVKPNKDWCWLQWLWSGRWSVNYYSWSRLGPAWQQRSTSIARLGVKYVSIRPLLPHISCHSTIHHPTTIAHCSGSGGDLHFGNVWILFMDNLQNSNISSTSLQSILLLAAIHQSVLGGVPRCQHPGAEGGAGDHRPRPGPPTSRGPTPVIKR